MPVSSSSPPTRRRAASGLSLRPPRRAIVLTLALLLVALGLLAAGLLADFLTPASPHKAAPTVLVSVPAGASARGIGEILEKHGLVRHAMGFVLAARLEGVAGKMRAGHYELSPAMPPRQMAVLIALGQTAEDVMVVPEGFTVAQIAHRLAQAHMAREKPFLTLAQTQGQTLRVNGFRPPNANLEGYLFPDTYRIPRGASERDIISLMLDTFRKRVLTKDGPALARFPGGLPAAVNLASLVEREAEVGRDRPLIAAVLRNRLTQKMRLQCDATVQYALPEHRARLLYADLKTPSPYNTYLHAGLPPTPICNPGLPSIEAVLRPAQSDALYYVARPDGSHIFSRTLAEHDRAIAAVRAGHAGG